MHSSLNRGQFSKLFTIDKLVGIEILFTPILTDRVAVMPERSRYTRLAPIAMFRHLAVESALITLSAMNGVSVPRITKQGTLVTHERGCLRRTSIAVSSVVVDGLTIIADAT